MAVAIERHRRHKGNHKPQFIVDAQGIKRAVVLDIKEYEELLEDLECRRIITLRENDERIPLAQVKLRLKKNGLL